MFLSSVGLADFSKIFSSMFSVHVASDKTPCLGKHLNPKINLISTYALKLGEHQKVLFSQEVLEVQGQSTPAKLQLT